MVLEELRDVAYAAKPEKRTTKQSRARNVNSRDPDIKIETETTFEYDGNASFDDKLGENDKEVDVFVSPSNVRVVYSPM